MKQKILVVFGTRPEAIKMIPVIKALQKRNSKIYICVTGQHREMLDQVLQFFDIQPDFDLNVMSPNQDLSTLTSKIILQLKDIISKIKPHWVVVQGDTTTTFCAALSAFYHKIPVAHIEAGLRTGDPYKPWPEEVNRKLVTHIAKIHFAPTNEAKSHLIKEGVNQESIHVTGNTSIDALLDSVKVVEKMPKKFATKYQLNTQKKIILVTGHRRENFGKGLEEICEALKSIALKYDGVHIIYPVHPNPNVQKTVNDILANQSRIQLIEPLSYPQFVYLMTKSYFIITDSGGIQEEAPSLNKPVLVTRESTERQEVVNCGAAYLVGTSKEKIMEKVGNLLEDKKMYDAMSTVSNPYGDGNAAEKIANILLQIRVY
ncbi:non-hydrolyzing UDP-N-acetylglucosamine 2-epimerase [Candidatus Uabimicrobium amorphum]|uniref:UDP-N-acetylglucosamine 2-epimerase (non-hydrolyzing) n=1 Tax=Uabimicrobium amorphum TaxID=2596890 RepID=A0A5S9F7C7_UABAM|nr:UDP-N-acetylglucosamine 2-epimerase (non-hydrolyzing) [Candidatus Uabimicrobium amorphum]BBM87579.1 UDP-N-acetyl glucosamine 2-epimerase [Candidatus Uabimicrobium amorphum]